MSRSISVVIPTRSRAGRILAAVEPLLSDPAALDVVVVVDGSRDGTLELLQDRARTAPVLRPVWQDHAGVGAARRRGAEESRGRLLLLLDDDVVPPSDLATRHAVAQAENPGHVVVGALDTPRAPRGVDAVTTELYRTAWAHCRSEYERNPASVLEHLWLGNVSLPRETALRIGLDDPEMGTLFFEDRDLGLRLLAHGVPAVFRADLVARHDHQRTLAAFRADALRQGRALCVLHRRYPDRVAEPTALWIAGRAPMPARWILAVAASDVRLGTALTAVLQAIATLFGRLRLWQVQRLAVVLLQRTGQATGVAADGQSTVPWRAPEVPVGAAELLVPAAGGTVGPARRRLRRRRDRTTTYVVRRGWAGATVLVPVGRPDLAAAVTANGPLSRRRKARRGISVAVQAVLGRHRVEVDGRDGSPPAAVAAAFGPHAPAAALITGGGGPRRRAAFLVPGAIVKVGSGADAPARAAHEQEILTRLQALGIGTAVPRPLGHGSVGSLTWSAESAATGVPLAELLADTSPAGRARARRWLERMADWLAEVAVATRTATPVSAGAPALADALVGVCGILQHGDLASGYNVLVDRREFAVIDWETALWEGRPLADVLPLLGGALAAGRGAPAEQADYVLRLCAGAAPESCWMFAVLRRYCRRAGVPRTAVGALATLAWKRQAAMQDTHRELVAAAGGSVPVWESMWGGVAEGWPRHDGLGAPWTAFGSR